ncbi:MAG: hypothetical protein POH28_09755 [Acidocella sp.]|nr:hypothetical protein [Acidocella sp.]
MSQKRNLRVAQAAGIGLAQRGIQLLTALITLPLALHSLGLSGFGIWGAAISLSWLTGLLDFGLGSALITLLPQCLAAGDFTTARAQITAALSGSAALSVVILIAGLGLLRLTASPLTILPLDIAICGLALNIPMSIAGNIWFGLQKGHMAGLWELAQTLLTLAFLVLAAACHAGVTVMVGAVYLALLLANTGSLIQLLHRHEQLRPRGLAGAEGVLRGVLGQGGLLFAIAAASSCSFMFDNLAALHWLGAAASAQITVALRLGTTATGLFTVITQPLWPAFVEATTLQDRRWATRSLLWGTLLVAGLGIAGGAIIIYRGAAILRWWLHADIGINQTLLWSIAAWIMALSIPRVCTLYFNACAILRFQVAASIAALAVSLALKITLAPKFGPAGILAATAIAWVAIIWPAYAWRLSRPQTGTTLP